MRLTKLAVPALIAAASAAHAQPKPASNLTLTAPITTWDEAIPLGNGLLGGLLWGGGSQLNLSLDRADLWDLRPAANYGSDGYRYADMVRLVREKKEDSLHIRFDQPYDNIPNPTKLPAGRIVFTLANTDQAKSFALDLANAEASVALSAPGSSTNAANAATRRVSAFFSAVDTVALVQLPSLTSLTIKRPASLNTLGYTPAQFGNDNDGGFDIAYMRQRAAGNLTYVVAVGRTRGESNVTAAITVATTADGADPLAIARTRIVRALKSGYDAARTPHFAWWTNYWRTSSSLSVPDSALQSHLDLVQYYYGAAARDGTPPIPLQGVWTADGEALPPWKGDLHNDLNTQTTYLAAHATGASDALRGWLNYNWKLLPRYQQFARDFYGVSNGAAVPGVMALDGSPLGGWGQYSLSPTMGLWVAQSFHLEWRYTRDTTFLRTRAYPFVSAVATTARALLQRDAAGAMRLPLSTSPEIFDNSMRAWLPSMSNFDLALLHWAFGALDEMATALGDAKAAADWRAANRALAPIVVDPTSRALPFAVGLPYNESHRHFSHAMAFHPLALLSPERAPDSVTISRTLAQLRQYGTDGWTGYSYAWYGAMLARAGQSDAALKAVETYRRAFILRNGFHANGDQTKSGLSVMTYRPVTLEGNFLALHATQEMLLQSWDGTLRVFPAVSDRWRDASFRDLRAEGGYRVSAVRVAGRTQSVSITSSVGGTLRLRDPFPGTRVQWSIPTIRREGRDIVVKLSRGQTLTGRRL